MLITSPARTIKIRDVCSTYAPALQPDSEDFAYNFFQTQETVLRLTSSLQTTLDAEMLIQLFAEEVRKDLQCDQIEFFNHTNSLTVAVGEPARHRVQYSLTISGINLGELVFSRRTKFSKAEINNIESLIMPLVYPLRNALQYLAAINSAMLDPLTTVGNRIALDQAVSRETEFSRRHQHDLSMLVIDIDHFKKINDQHGHAIGDEVLKATAAKIVQCVRKSDLVFRFGGEEFVVLLSKTALIGAQRLAERTRAAIANSPCKIGKRAIKTSVSIGVAALYSEDGEDALFRRADQALYQAKKLGRNTVFVAEL